MKAQTFSKLLAAALFSLSGILSLSASEGGASTYLQGANSDWAAGVSGPPGLYFRSDTLFYTAEIGANPRGGRISLGVDQKVWAELLKFAYITPVKIFGGTYSFALCAIVMVDVHATAGLTVGPRSAFVGGDTSGFGDLVILPANLNWNWGNHHLSFTPGIIAPTGSYSADRLLNNGRNYWAFDLAGAYTYLDQKRGHEISLSTGFIFNTENSATNYRTGTEFHLDFQIAQYLSPKFGIGLAGYWYQQITDDRGPLPPGFSASQFRASGVGLGPSIVYVAKIGKKDINFVAKALFDIETSNRAKGSLYMFSFGLKF